MSFAIGEVVLVPIPFTNLVSNKVRPALIIGHSSYSRDLFVVPVSSKLDSVDFLLRDWKHAGLNVPCGAKSQIATVERRIILKTLGTLSPVDNALLKERLRTWLQL